jgi:elongation factor P hydroxylase
MAELSVSTVTTQKQQLPKHHYQEIIDLFDECFSQSHNTRLIKGDDEPIYLPADPTCEYHRVVFAHGYFSSALHEISHWLIAGPKRRLLEDFGYWYRPDGRTAQEQAEFEKVEVKPQALEWILSVAAGHKFYISADNLSGESTDNSAFKQAVYEQVECYLTKGLSERATCLKAALCRYYGVDPSFTLDQFDLNSV